MTRPRAKGEKAWKKRPSDAVCGGCGFTKQGCDAAKEGGAVACCPDCECWKPVRAELEAK